MTEHHIERGERKVARGRADDTPVIVHTVLFVGIGTFVALLVLAVLLIYYLA